MPAIYLRFDSSHERELMEAAGAVEFNVVLDDRINRVATSLGLCTLDDMVGVSEGEWSDVLDAMPPHLHEHWSPDKSPWFSCDDGIAWGRRLIAYIADHPQEFSDWPSHQSDATEELRTFVDVLESVRSTGVNFQLFYAA